MVTLAPAGAAEIPKTFDGYELSYALQSLVDEGAASVGINCSRGPRTMIPIIKQLRKDVQVNIAA